MPLSTISLKYTFNLSVPILEDRQQRLNSNMMEVLSCVKVWKLADAKQQYCVKDKDLEDRDCNNGMQ
jgi:hypothetical protein